MPDDMVEYKGTTFVRLPGSPYYTGYRSGRRVRGLGQLHVEIWKDANEVDSVPEGCVIHHVDFDPFNNEPSNLACVTRKEHGQLHAADNREARREWIEKIRPLANEWHGSEEGRAWHRQHAQEAWSKTQRVEKACEHCGDAYQSAFPERAHYCSNRCAQAARDESRYEVEKSCPVCGKRFMQNKYKYEPKTCSRQCGQRWRRMRP